MSDQRTENNLLPKREPSYIENSGCKTVAAKNTSSAGGLFPDRLISIREMTLGVEQLPDTAACSIRAGHQ